MRLHINAYMCICQCAHLCEILEFGGFGFKHIYFSLNVKQVILFM